MNMIGFPRVFVVVLIDLMSASNDSANVNERAEVLFPGFSQGRASYPKVIIRAFPKPLDKGRRSLSQSLPLSESVHVL
jgi:hypothetical protein